MIPRVSINLVMAAALSFTACDSKPADAATACIEPVGLCALDDVLKSPDALKEPQLLSALIVTGDINRLTRWVSSQEKLHPGFGLNLYDKTFGLDTERALAAVALATAAFNSKDPYVDQHWLAVGGKYRDDLRVSRTAAFLLKNIGYESWEADVLHRPPGQATIIATVVRLTPDDFDALRHTYFDLAWGQQSLKPLRRQLLNKLSALAGSDPDCLALVADLEARSFSNTIAAEAAMKAGGDAADDYFISGLRAEIAAARLRQFGYDKASAQMVAVNAIEEGPLVGIEETLQLLGSVNAHAELRRIASAYLRTARSYDDISVNTAELFAAASDAYRLAGDANAALASAREGMRIIPQALSDFGPNANMAERRRLAGEDNGMRTAPALALYRAGAETEALASNFLSGRELLQRWTKSLDQFDPAWLVDDGPKWREVIISGVISTRDRAFAARVYDAFLASPETEPRDLAILAAAAGKRQAAIGHLKAMREAANIARELHGDRTYYRLATVTAWKTAEMLLENLPQAR